MISEIQSVDKQLEDDFFKSFVSDKPEDISTINEYYFWLVEFLASKFKSMGPNQEELEREAYYGLLDAACSYKPDSESCFGLYALPIIKERLVNLISDTAMTSLGVKSVSDMLYKAKNISNRVSNNILNDSTDWEAAKALNIDEDTLNTLIFGNLINTTPQEIIRKSKESLKSISDKPSDIAGKFIQDASNYINNIIDNFED